MTKKTRQPKPTIETQDMWALWREDHYITIANFAPNLSRRDAESAFQDHRRWREMYRDGYRAVKVRVEPVE